MEKDSPNEGRKRPNEPSRPGGLGGNWLIKIIPFALMFLLRRPKLLVPILIAGAIWFFFFRGEGMLGDLNYEYQASDQFSFGATLSEEEYDKAEVFEPLAVGAGNAIPARASLEQFAPRRLHQGRQGSCSGWAGAYAARTISYARSRGMSPDRMAFSPSFLYNQIALPGCQGAYMRDAMEGLRQIGSLPFTEFGYDDRSCQIMPDNFDQQEAAKYRIKGYNRLTTGATNYVPDLYAIKQNIAQGAPVVIGMMVGNSFMQGMVNRDTWLPSRQDYSGYGLSGHAMCVVGYDDDYRGGAFRLMNSWGEEWGDRGMAWVRYSDFEQFVKEAYGIYPEGETNKFDPAKLQVRFGLVDNETQNLIPLSQREKYLFQTRSPIGIGDRFKVAVTNDIECYIYVFGRETDGSNYVLFPYTDKHSAYCGITGTRLFPRDYSMVADDIGARDQIAIVVTKEALDYNQFSELANRSRQSSYAGRIAEALGSQRITDVAVEEIDGAISFTANTSGRNAVGIVIEIDKR